MHRTEYCARTCEKAVDEREFYTGSLGLPVLIYAVVEQAKAAKYRLVNSIVGRIGTCSQNVSACQSF